MVAKEDEAETCLQTTSKFVYQEILTVVVILSVVLLNEYCKMYGISEVWIDFVVELICSDGFMILIWGVPNRSCWSNWCCTAVESPLARNAAMLLQRVHDVTAQ